MCFLFLILDDKIPKFRCVKFEKKNWHQVKEQLTSTCIKQVISKPSNTVILYYLAFNAFYFGFVSEIDFISVSIIILNNFLRPWTDFELDIETYYLDSFLELSKARPPLPPPPPNSPKIKLKIEF